MPRRETGGAFFWGSAWFLVTISLMSTNPLIRLLPISSIQTSKNQLNHSRHAAPVCH
jgi:hypothetical protein